MKDNVHENYSKLNQMSPKSLEVIKFWVLDFHLAKVNQI